MATKRKSVAQDAPIDLNLLSTFLAVADAQSFSEAARKLDLRRSSVSRAVASLEDSLGVQLFSRTTRKVALTTAGAALSVKLGPQLASLRESLGELPEREDGPSGRLRITAPTDLGSSVLAPIVTAFSQRYPHVELQVLLSSRVVDLVGERFDLALRVAPGRRLADSSLIARKVLQLELQLFASPSYRARAGTPRTAEELANHEWVQFRGFEFRAPLLPPRQKPKVSCDDIFFLYQALKAGAGVGGLPGYLVRDDLARGSLVRVAPRFSLGVGSLFLVHPPAQHVPRKVSAFIEFVVDWLERRPLV